MFRFFALFAASIVLISCQQPPANAQFDEADREEIREIVREYIIENPEIIEEALIELQRRARPRTQLLLHGDRGQSRRHLQ